MKRIKNTEKIEVLGATFMGVKELMECARSGKPKDGVYVGEDAQLYPCFDSEDSLYENRYFRNFVFAESKEEMQERLSRLRGMDQIESNYNKLTADLHPMAYWQGDTYYDVILTEGDV